MVAVSCVVVGLFCLRVCFDAFLLLLLFGGVCCWVLWFACFVCFVGVVCVFVCCLCVGDVFFCFCFFCIFSVCVSVCLLVLFA